MTVHALGHVNLRAPAATVERLRHFYVDIIGLHEGPRPRFRSGSRGCWLYAGNEPIVHLTVTADGKTTPIQHGAFHHFALTCDDLDTTRARLDAAGVRYSVDVVDALRQVQLFLTDPAGVGVELTFSHA